MWPIDAEKRYGRKKVSYEKLRGLSLVFWIAVVHSGGRRRSHSGFSDLRPVSSTGDIDQEFVDSKNR